VSALRGLSVINRTSCDAHEELLSGFFFSAKGNALSFSEPFASDPPQVHSRAADKDRP